MPISCLRIPCVEIWDELLPKHGWAIAHSANPPLTPMRRILFSLVQGPKAPRPGIGLVFSPYLNDFYESLILFFVSSVQMSRELTFIKFNDAFDSAKSSQ